jgi:3-methyl-2-oxobutanoate hydroxymethyltransferase
MSYHVSRTETVHNAAKLIRAGATCVKLEGGRKRVPMIDALVDAEIPVMGHIGLTPQSVNAMGGFKVQAREREAAVRLVAAAKELQHAGCFALVLEGIPGEVAELVTNALEIPTIGIGAGGRCDGQVLVMHDLLGMEDRTAPKFVRRYADVKSVSVDAVRAYADDVRSGAFPSDKESYHLSAEQAESMALYGSGT